MTDIDFRYEYVPDNYEHRVQRSTTLYPLVGQCRTPHGIEMATDKLIGIWRMRLTTLLHHGWRSGSKPEMIQAARNCRPSFAKSFPASWCCRLTICPFCYARRVGELWRTINHVFHCDEGGEPKWYRPTEIAELGDIPDAPAHCRLRLVERIVTYPVSLMPGDYEDRDLIQPRLQALLADIARKRAGFIRDAKTAGGWQQTTIEPRSRNWRVKTRQLLVYQEKKKIPELVLEPGPSRKIIVHDLPTRAVLAEAVTHACRYPRRWMTGEPGLTVLLLQTLSESKAKLFATFGAFRGKML